LRYVLTHTHTHSLKRCLTGNKSILFEFYSRGASLQIFWELATKNSMINVRCWIRWMGWQRAHRILKGEGCQAVWKSWKLSSVVCVTTTTLKTKANGEGKGRQCSMTSAYSKSLLIYWIYEVIGHYMRGRNCISVSGSFIMFQFRWIFMSISWIFCVGEKVIWFNSDCAEVHIILCICIVYINYNFNISISRKIWMYMCVSVLSINSP